MDQLPERIRRALVAHRLQSHVSRCTVFANGTSEVDLSLFADQNLATDVLPLARALGASVRHRVQPVDSRWQGAVHPPPVIRLTVPPRQPRCPWWVAPVLAEAVVAAGVWVVWVWHVCSV